MERNKRGIMKKSILVSPLAVVLGMMVLLSVNSVGGSDEKVQWKSFDEGMAEARGGKKKVLLDVYTDWCGWCKKMEANTYAHGSVASYLRDHYIAIKLNAESSRRLTYKNSSYTEAGLASAFGITGYPSTIFLTSDGEPITVFPGYADATQFASVLSFIAEDHYLTKSFDDYSSSLR
jgi:thioredoxin-related protein